MAIERVREGEAPSAVIASYGFARTTIYKWIKAAAQPGLGLKALRSSQGSGCPRRLTSRQEQQVFRWINSHDPRQYGPDSGLWTRAVVASLIEQKFGIQRGRTAVGDLLARLGLTPQKPLQRANQRDPAAIEQWQRDTFPAIARQAKAAEGEVYFWDEAGFRADAVHGRTLGGEGADAGDQAPRPAPVDQRRLGGHAQRGGSGTAPMKAA
jgi:transposase